MVVGHSSGVAAAMAVNGNIAVQDVSVPALQKILRAQGQVLTLAERKPVGPSPVPPPPPPSLVPLSVGPCTADGSNISLKLVLFENANVSLVQNAKSQCASAIGYATRDGTAIVAATCHTDASKAPGKANQEWRVVRSGRDGGGSGGGGGRASHVCLAEDNAAESCTQSCLSWPSTSSTSAGRVALGDCKSPRAVWVVLEHCSVLSSPGCIRTGPAAAEDTCLLSL